MKIILALLISLSLCFTTSTFADQQKTPTYKKYSCGCSKNKQKHRTTAKS